jgi:D-glycerate 3-kinase
MDEAALQRFIMHYERLTRHILAEMPERADLVLRLDTTHQIDAVRVNKWPAGCKEQS